MTWGFVPLCQIFGSIYYTFLYIHVTLVLYSDKSDANLQLLNLWPQEQHNCQSFRMEWRRRLNRIIRPALTDAEDCELRTTNRHASMYSGCGIIPLPLFSQPPVLLFTCQTLHRWKNLWRHEGLYYSRHDTLASVCWKSICSQIIIPKSQGKQTNTYFHN